MTEKFYKYWNLSEKYLDIVEERLENNLSSEEFETFNRILKKISNEMMPEVGLPEREQ